MSRAYTVCTTPECGTITQGGRCDECRTSADARRGSASARGYNSAGHKRFRTAVLDRDPICVQCSVALSTVADHWPSSRRELLEQGLDPNDPTRGRGVCKRCHDVSTSSAQPGGWNA